MEDTKKNDLQLYATGTRTITNTSQNACICEA